MRHFIAHLATYVIGGLLVAGAVLWAWGRSAQVAVTREPTLLARFEPEPPVFDWRELGARSYRANCQACHGANGEGWDQYPGVGHTAGLVLAPPIRPDAPDGRAYVIDLHLYGLTSDRWRAPMPPMGHLADVETAAVLNHVLAHYGNAERLPPDTPGYHPHEIAARRGQRSRPADVNAYRPAIPYIAARP